MRFLPEPIVHFALLGVLAFATYYVLRPDPLERSIAVDAHKRSELAVLFELRQHRRPSARELDELAERWVEDEVLFREALELGLSQRDGAIHVLMIAQMRARLSRSLELPRPDQALGAASDVPRPLPASSRRACTAASAGSRARWGSRASATCRPPPSSRWTGWARRASSASRRPSAS